MHYLIRLGTSLSTEYNSIEFRRLTEFQLNNMFIQLVEEQPHFVTNGSLDRPSMHHCICSDYIIHSIFKRVRRHFDLRESHPPRDYNLGPTPVAVKRPAISG